MLTQFKRLALIASLISYCHFLSFFAQRSLCSTFHYILCKVVAIQRKTQQTGQMLAVISLLQMERNTNSLEHHAIGTLNAAFSNRIHQLQKNLLTFFLKGSRFNRYFSNDQAYTNRWLWSGQKLLRDSLATDDNQSISPSPLQSH